MLPPVERLNFEISGDEQIDPAGEITAVLESIQIVVQVSIATLLTKSSSCVSLQHLLLILAKLSHLVQALI